MERQGQAYAWTEIGHALVGLQEMEEAAAAYSTALTSRCALAQRHLEMEVLAGLIRIDLERQELAEADRKAQILLEYLQSNRLLGVKERAAAIDAAHLRESYLQIEAHRTVIQAWIAEGKKRVY